MSKFFYWKLALTNLKKNRKTILPYIVTCIMTTAMFYIMTSLAHNSALGNNTRMVLGFGYYVIGIFAVIFLFYTNSFLIKQRKKEFGLFNILGLEKKHIVRMIGYETFIMGVGSSLIGILFGILLDKAMFLILLKLFEQSVKIGFYISKNSILVSCILFGGIYFLIFLNSIRQIHLANPIELLHSGNYGEKEPKNKWFFTLFGILFIGIGYFISLQTEDIRSAMNLFFIAVIFVIIGTYFLFTSGSITLLKILKSNKNYYYKTNHFISISSMMYRMKRNAIGLANICILSTMVLVTLSASISLWLGIGDAIEKAYPKDIHLLRGISVESKDYRAEQKKFDDAIGNILDTIGIHKKDSIEYVKLDFIGIQKSEGFDLQLTEDDFMQEVDVCNVRFITLADYNSIMGTKEILKEDEILLYTDQNGMKGDSIDFFGKSYLIQKRINNLPYSTQYDGDMPLYLIVVSDDKKIMELAKEETAAQNGVYIDIGFNTDGTQEENLELNEKLIELSNAKSEQGFFIDSKAQEWEYMMTGLAGILFVGVFLSVLFIMAAILIMYYKQITEGYEDKKRIEIMQKVGIDQREMKDSIRSQVLTVFFLPLLVTGIHIIFAFPILYKILLLFQLFIDNQSLFTTCMIVCFISFGLIYSLVYMLTAKTYYSIVKR